MGRRNYNSLRSIFRHLPPYSDRRRSTQGVENVNGTQWTGDGYEPVYRVQFGQAEVSAAERTARKPSVVEHGTKPGTTGAIKK